jgi:hypothetical protein
MPPERGSVRNGPPREKRSAPWRTSSVTPMRKSISRRVRGVRRSRWAALTSRRRSRVRPHRSGAESETAPNSLFGVWWEPGVIVSAGSRAKWSGESSHSSAYLKLADSRPRAECE